MLFCSAFRPADHLAIGQNEKINACAKWNMALSTLHVAWYFRRGFDPHRFEECCVLMREDWLEPFRSIEMVQIAPDAQRRNIPMIGRICRISSEDLCLFAGPKPCAFRSTTPFAVSPEMVFNFSDLWINPAIP